MVKKIALATLILFFMGLPMSCIKHQKQTNNQITNKIQGKWTLNRWELYHTLHFLEGEEVWIDNHIDTVFTFWYEINQDTLFLYDYQSRHLLYTNVIAKLDEDSLVFHNFMEKSGEQSYGRIGNPK